MSPECSKAPCRNGKYSAPARIPPITTGPVTACRAEHTGFRDSRRQHSKPRFPFATLTLEDPKIPLKIEITGWSPFTPPEPNDSSLPVAALEYRFTNPTDKPIEAVYSFNARNFLAPDEKPGKVTKTENGFVLAAKKDPKGKPWDEAAFAAISLNPDANINCAWFRGGWFDPLTMAWKDIEQGKCYRKARLIRRRTKPRRNNFCAREPRTREKKKPSRFCFAGIAP